MKIWLDDKRLPLSGYALWATTAQECIDLLIKHEGQIESVSLDHDLGDVELTGEGNDVVKWLEEAAYYEKYPSVEIIVHTSNTPAATRMLQGACNAYRYWGFGFNTNPKKIDYDKVKGLVGLNPKWSNVPVDIT
jgi:hypothetical protein